MRVGFVASVAGLLLAACATPAPRELPPARVEVEVLRGAAPQSAKPPRIALVVDATASMGSAAIPGVTRLEAARTRALGILAAAPADARLTLSALGPGEGTCRRPAALASGRDAAADAVRGLAPGGEGSLAEALQDVGRALEESGASEGARVVVLSDLDERCGGDLCVAVESLVAAGASLDLVVLGDRPTPACVAAAEPGPGPGPAGGPGAVAPAPAFRVLPASGEPASGVAGGAPVTVAAGAARVEVALSPPLLIGPLPLAPGSLVRVRVLDFPRASPPQREWVLDVVEDGPGSGAAPSSRP